ncbi:hypothetical protein [Streptomyces fungicidicus]|uniref:hypothetical protein n=1 Tax=Streptomyces fungicidicus TaxID=68203 RepID=UPI00380DC59F
MSAADRVLGVLPWIVLVLLLGLVTGLIVAWISRKAGDNAWEAARHGFTAAVLPTGPLLAVVTLVSTLTLMCR